MTSPEELRPSVEPRQYIASIRAVFMADDDIDAELIGNEMAEAVAEHVLDDDDTVDVTQIIPSAFAPGQLTPLEICEQIRKTRDIFIRTRIIQLYDLARELDKVAWIIEHRDESTFDLTNYDYTAFIEHAEKVLNGNG